MSLWSEGIDRSKTGAVRTEDDKTNPIDEFFASQTDVRSYEITDNKNGVVNVEGSVHLHEADLDDGELFFKIDRLTGNLYCHCKHIRQSVVPTEIGGEIIFVPNEEELWKNRQATENDDDFDMGYITAQNRTKDDLITNVKLAFADLISAAATEGVDLERLWKDVLEQNANKDNYKLRIEFEKNKLGKTITNIYVSDDDNDKLELNPIQTAIYLMFAMDENGFTVDDLKTTDWIVAKQIYSQLANTEQKTYIKDKDTGEYLNYTDGILNKAFKPTTINGYISEIRKKLEKLICVEDVRNGFSIVGKRGEALKIGQSTPEIRELICEEFGFD